MEAGRTILSKIAALTIVMAIAGAVARAGDSSSYATDIVRGFNESGRCISNTHKSSEWCVAFSDLIRKHKTATSAFLLGANFGFSFKSESSAEGMATSETELRRVAECAALARLRYEAIKRKLGVNDSDIAKLLNIRAGKFAAWKARTATHDLDRSVICTGHSTEL